MKLDYFNVLRKKSTPDEIAEQIVALEIKQKQCEAQRERAKKDCKDIRSRIMCGEKIPPDVQRNTDKAYEDARLDLEAVADSIEDLKKLLHSALESNCTEEKDRVAKLQRQKDASYEGVLRAVLKAKGRFIGLATAIYRHPEEAEVQSLNIGSRFHVTAQDPYYADYQAGVAEGIAELKHPTVAEIEEQCSVVTNQFMWFKADEESERLLEKYRKLAEAPAGIKESDPQAAMAV